MKPLWKRLSKKNKEKLTRSVNLYPTASGSLIKKLRLETAWTKLTFQEIIWLMQETTGKKTTIENVDKLFDNEKI